MTLSVGDAGLELDETEQLILVHDRPSGMGAAIAIDDTTLGPAIGGVRWRAYPNETAAIAEVRRLARVMTLKSAVAGIPSGGAKTVVFRPLPTVEGAPRRAVLEALGRVVHRLDELYVPGLDMGTAIEDLRAMATQAPGICTVEPAEQTAAGLFSAVAAAVAWRFETGLANRSVLVQGVGHVGARLAAHLAEAGAVVTVADVEEDLAMHVAKEIDGSAIASDEVIGHPCDVFAPCAVGRIVDAASVARFHCAVIAGAANDVLAHRDAADMLMARGIDYVPDFLVNSGGVIRIHAERAGWHHERLAEEVHAIGRRVAEVLQRARETGQTPLVVAEELASERLGRRVTLPD